MATLSNFVLGGVTAQYDWYGSSFVNGHRRLSALLTLGPTPFFLMTTEPSSEEETRKVILYFVSPCCATSLSHTYRGAECLRCDRIYAMGASAVELPLSARATQWLQAWLDLNSWDPLQAILVSNSIDDIARAIEVPETLRVGEPRHISYAMDFMARKFLGLEDPHVRS